jgi:ankyrin repeat protein
MIRPEELKKNEPLFWSTGTGTDVWDMFCAAISGDAETLRRLVARDPSLVRCHYAYRTPLYFAVRENQIEAARFLIERGSRPVEPEIARDRGHGEMLKMLEAAFAVRYGASPKGNAMAAAIRERNPEEVRSLLDASPSLLHKGDERGCQPIHWAVMTRQIDLIDELLARSADINARRGDGACPIHLSNEDYTYRGWRDVPKDVAATPAEVLAHLIARGPRRWRGRPGADMARLWSC